MSDLDNREKGNEANFARQQEMRFKAEIRRNKLLGMWAAQLMGYSDEEAKSYAEGIAKPNFKEAGDEPVFRKIRADFDARNIDQSDHQIRRTMDELLATAIKQIESSA